MLTGLGVDAVKEPFLQLGGDRTAFAFTDDAAVEFADGFVHAACRVGL